MQNAAPWSQQNWDISKGSHNTCSVLLNAFSHKLAPAIWKPLAVSLHIAIDLQSQTHCTCTAASLSHSMSRGILCWCWTFQTGVHWHCLNPSHSTEQLISVLLLGKSKYTSLFCHSPHDNPKSTVIKHSFHISLTPNNSLDCVRDHLLKDAKPMDIYRSRLTFFYNSYWKSYTASF